MAEVVKDLSVKVEAPFAVYPSKPKATRCMFMSNIDQTLVAPVGTLSFFMPCSLSFQEVVKTYTESLSELLDSYDFMAGRLKFNEGEDRLEIDCNGAGALFAVASADLTLEELGDIYTPNLAFKQFVLHNSVAFSHGSDLPLFTLQATSFKCGAFVVGAGLNHCILDGVACFYMMVNLASIARGKGLVVEPSSDRTLLKARSPPKIEHDHYEFSKLSEIQMGSSTNFSARGSAMSAATPPPMSPPYDENILKLFQISGDNIEKLKDSVKGGSNAKVTSFEVATALLWRARALAVDMGPQDVSTVLFPVDIRSKLEPLLPREYAGNAVIPGYARATVKELEEESFPALVAKVQQGLRRINKDYARSAVDWLEVHKGIPCAVNSFSVVAWWRLGMEDVEFPWGKPHHIGPVIFSHSPDLVLLLPSRHHKDHSLNIALALPPHQMTKFERLLQTL